MLGAIATALSGGSFAAAFVCGLTFAAKSAVTGAVMGGFCTFPAPSCAAGFSLTRLKENSTRIVMIFAILVGVKDRLQIYFVRTNELKANRSKEMIR